MSDHKGAFNRRDVLKGISAGTAGVALASGKASAQSSYDITVSTSDGLYQEYGTDPLDKAYDYIVGAFNDVAPSANISKGENSVPAPVEEHNQSFSAETPCSPYTVQYDGILAWWDEYCTCQASFTEDDANLLILRDHSGGKASGVGGQYCVASGGNNLDDIPSAYTKYLLASNYPSIMNTILEEIGHCLQIGLDQEDYNFEQTGSTLEELSNYYITAIDTPGSTNECGEQVDPEDGWAQTWSDCTVNDYWY